jgi:hypothetical protein
LVILQLSILLSVGFERPSAIQPLWMQPGWKRLYVIQQAQSGTEKTARAPHVGRRTQQEPQRVHAHVTANHHHARLGRRRHPKF